MKSTIIYLLITLAASCNVMAQDLESIAKAPILTTSGGISVSQITTLTPGDSIANENPYSL